VSLIISFARREVAVVVDNNGGSVEDEGVKVAMASATAAAVAAAAAAWRALDRTKSA